MTPQEARADIIAKLLVLFADAERRPDIREHRGQFQSLDEIKSIALRSPTVLVAYRSFQQLERLHDRLECVVLWAIHVIAADTRAERRNELASGVTLLIADHVAETANTWDFAKDYATGLTAVDASTLALDQNGISLWQITWQQRCAFTIKDFAALITAFDGFDADHLRPGAVIGIDQPQAQTRDNYEDQP